MATGQAMALATSCVCTSVGISSTLPQGSPSSEHGRSFHSYGNDQDPQRCGHPSKVTQLVGSDAPCGKWEMLTVWPLLWSAWHLEGPQKEE